MQEGRFFLTQISQLAKPLGREAGYTRAERLTVATRHPLAIYNRLPQWAAEDGVKIRELHSTDESLQNLFESLFKSIEVAE